MSLLSAFATPSSHLATAVAGTVPPASVHQTIGARGATWPCTVLTNGSPVLQMPGSKHSGQSVVQLFTMLASALALAPFSGARTQALVAGSEKGVKHPGKAGVAALRWVAMHFCTHFVTEPMNFVTALLVPVWHFTSSLLGSVTGGNCARAGADPTHTPAAATTASPKRLLMISVPLRLLLRTATRRAAIPVRAGGTRSRSRKRSS